MHNKTRHLGYIVQFFKRAETLKSVKSSQNAVKTRESFLDFILTIFRQLLFQPETARRAFSKRKTDFNFHRAKNKSASKPDFCSETKIFC